MLVDIFGTSWAERRTKQAGKQSGSLRQTDTHRRQTNRKASNPIPSKVSREIDKYDRKIIQKCKSAKTVWLDSKSKELDEQQRQALNSAVTPVFLRACHCDQ